MVNGKDTTVWIFGCQRRGKPAVVVSRTPCFIPGASESMESNNTWIDLGFNNIIIGINWLSLTVLRAILTQKMDERRQ